MSSAALPERKAFQRAIGLSQQTVRLGAVALAVSITGNVLQGAERWWDAQQSDNKVYVVFGDEVGSFTAVAEAFRDYAPERGAWINTAEEWLRMVRARPVDPATWEYQKHRVSVMTDRSLYANVNAWMIEAREELRNRAVFFEILEAKYVDTGCDPRQCATVSILWQEQVTGRDNAPWKRYSVLISLTKIPPSDTRQIKANRLGIYVTDYSHNPISMEES